jgi:hypothetical protein
VDRLSPGGLIVSVFTDLGPQQLGASLGDVRWHGVLNLDETVRNELPGQDLSRPEPDARSLPAQLVFQPDHNRQN